MPDILLFIAGSALVIFVLYDFLRTAISLSGLGPMSWWIAFPIWAVARQVAPWSERRLGLGVRGAIGPTILAVMAAAWIAVPLIGYTSMYAAGPSLVMNETDDPAGLIDRIAFAGSALSTLGASIVTPTSGWWDMLSMLAAVHGMIVMTLSVSFILTILQTTMEARGLAARCNALIGSEDPHQASAALRRIEPLGAQLCMLAVKLDASPLPGMFVPTDPTMNFPETVSRICDLLVAELAHGKGQSGDVGSADELRSAFHLIGRPARQGGSGEAFDPTQAWAARFSLPPRRAGMEG